MPRFARLIFVWAIASAIVLAAAASASAAGWLPMVAAPSVRGEAVQSVRVAVDDAGNVYAAWIEGNFVEVSKRPVGGGWETPQTLDPLVTAVTASHPDIAVDGAGNAVVVWTASPMSGGKTIKQARRPAGASAFLPSVTVPTAASASSDTPRLAVNRAGDAVLTVVQNSAQHAIVRAFLATAASDFSAASAATFRDYDAGANTTVTVADPAINETGDASIVWPVKADSPPRIDAAHRVHGDAAAFGPVENVVTDTPIKHDPSTAIDSQGNTLAAWDEDTTPGGGQLRAYTRPAAAPPWVKLSDLDAGQSGGALPDVGFDFNRIAVAAWSAGGELRTSSQLPGGQFAQPPQSLTGATEQPFDIQFDTNPAGFGVLVWSGGGSASAARAVVRPNAGAFGPIATISPAGHGAASTRVAVDPPGNAAAVWIDSFPVDANKTVVTAEYDATAPKFTTPPTVPDTAEQGKTTAFSAAATDDWSQPVIEWDFGDGTSAPGGGVTHAYAKAGTYPVTTTATDSVGNFVTSTHDVKVTPPPVGTPTEGKDFNASAVSGTVLVSVPKGKGAGRILARAPVHAAAAISAPAGFTQFRPLGKNDNIPIGSILDSTRGIALISMAANKTGTKLQKGKFSKGVFRTKQTTHSPLTSAEMMGGGNFRRDCRPQGAKVSAARRRPHRQLFASVKGRFRTRGRHSTATVRGTKYLVKDSCRGTLTLVTQGRVVVRDFRKHRTVIVRTGHRYLAAQ